MRFSAATLMIAAIFAAIVGAACPIGDISGDCTVDFRDVWELGEQWLDTSAGTADLTGEGSVDFNDFSVLAQNWAKTEWLVVINEIHSNPDVETELVEFIELYNAGPVDVDMSGWYFRDGITYTFPEGTILQAGEYLVVTEDAYAAYSPKTVTQKYGTSSTKVYGPFTGNLRNFGEKIELCNAAGTEIDQVDYKLGFPWPTVGDPIPASQRGEGHSMQLLDPLIDNDLGGSWRSAYPTPGAQNGVTHEGNSPTHIRQVRHSPKSPAANEPVTITAKITDLDGVAIVQLLYSIIEPGHYVKLDDPQYDAGWIPVFMNDDGLDADERADDDIFTAQIPADVQVHRRLIRYRIQVADAVFSILTVPYPDDPQPNFAYFVYDGVPAWHGALEPASSNPSRSEVKTFPAEVMRSLPVYHLIATEADVTKCQYNSSYENTRFRGTLVYDGTVYDHIEFKIRGEWSTYQSGKNKWKFFFTRGHDFQARDDYGRKYSTPWRVMNFSACATPWMPAHRGMAGVDEAIAFALYDKASVPSPRTHWLQFRIIDDSVEADPSSQYEGDLWGLYLAIEYPDGRFLDEHGLPDGNTYKMEGGGDKKHQGATQPANTSDLNSFRNGYNQTNTDTWWKDNLNLKHYYGFRAINRAINNSDLREGWNCYYYHNSETNLWSVIPWDLDMLYMPVYHWSGVLNIQNCLNHTEFAIGHRNYGRELQDLLVSSDQISQLVDELASIVNPPGQPLTMVDVDEHMWNYHPRTRSGHRGKFYQNPITHNDFDGQSILKVTVSSDHEGEMQWIKDFIQAPPGGGSSPASYGATKLDEEIYDSRIPHKPTVTYLGSDGFPINDLTFETTAFSDPQGSGTFAAMKWRIARVEPGSQFVPPDPQPDNTITLLAAES
ncbi:MAG: lamin tail domain-containing protein, partial [Planctomycetes bacterium]|nr:lamin tail domain-containing protein [Planctomycetota bacterium]